MGHAIALLEIQAGIQIKTKCREEKYLENDTGSHARHRRYRWSRCCKREWTRAWSLETNNAAMTDGTPCTPVSPELDI